MTNKLFNVESLSFKVYRNGNALLRSFVSYVVRWVHLAPFTFYPAPLEVQAS